MNWVWGRDTGVKQRLRRAPTAIHSRRRCMSSRRPAPTQLHWPLSRTRTRPRSPHTRCSLTALDASPNSPTHSLARPALNAHSVLSHRLRRVLSHSPRATLSPTQRRLPRVPLCDCFPLLCVHPRQVPPRASFSLLPTQSARLCVVSPSTLSPGVSAIRPELRMPSSPSKCVQLRSSCSPRTLSPIPPIPRPLPSASPLRRAGYAARADVDVMCFLWPAWRSWAVAAWSDMPYGESHILESYHLVPTRRSRRRALR